MRYLWYSMYAFVTALAIYSLFFSPARRHRRAAAVAVATETPAAAPSPLMAVPEGDVQIALLLDTSSSMDGLLEQARTQLWEIVGELQIDDKDQDRSVSVALYHYGNSRLDSSTGFIEKLSDLTPELDGVSVKLHALSTSGGKENAPEAISRAVEELAWSDDDSVEKVIVIAGNEGFSQGSVSPETAMQEAADKGIRVIPIFCANGGATSTGLASWQRAAELAQTELDTIDPDQVVAKIETPYDAAIVQKYQELEATKLTYGDADYRREVESVNYQATSYAQAKPIAAQADRAIAQSRQASTTDLVTAYGSNAVSIDAIDKEALPTALQGLSKDQQVVEIESRKLRRGQIESELEELDKKRKGHLSTAPSAAAGASRQSLGSSVRAKLRD